MSGCSYDLERGTCVTHDCPIIDCEMRGDLVEWNVESIIRPDGLAGSVARHPAGRRRRFRKPGSPDPGQNPSC